MKLPTIFIPERDTDRKIEELKQTPKIKEPEIVTLEALMKNDIGAFYGSINRIKDYPERRKKKEQIEDLAFEKIIKDTLSGVISWKQAKATASDLKMYTANALISNAEGKEIMTPIIFRTDIHHSDICGYLHLGDRRGPCRNTYNKRIENLAKEYFKIKLNK